MAETVTLTDSYYFCLEAVRPVFYLALKILWGIWISYVLWKDGNGHYAATGAAACMRNQYVRGHETQHDLKWYDNKSRLGLTHRI